MYITGIMERALAGNWIKAAWICIADILHLAGQGSDRLLNRQADDVCKDIPGSPTWRSAPHFNGADPAVTDLYLIFRQAKLLAIFTCRLQVAETASGKRRHCICMLFA